MGRESVIGAERQSHRLSTVQLSASVQHLAATHSGIVKIEPTPGNGAAKGYLWLLGCFASLAMAGRYSAAAGTGGAISSPG